MTEDGILGSAYTDAPDCKPVLTVGPDMPRASRICAIVPKGSKKVKMIFTGDIRLVYDIGL